ncbi:MAG: arginine repressor [Clostridia bacterium]|nr:arginine repressor [Clostridia bacterium]
MGKNSRQEKLIEIINAYEIDTQEDLAQKLNESGFNVTQATVSRDIKELNIIKVAGKSKKYKYSVIQQSEQKDIYKMFNMFKVSVTSITAAQNLVVVRTLMGNGLSAGTAIDKMKIPEIIGCVGGDDTIIIVTGNNDDALVVERKLKEQL